MTESYFKSIFIIDQDIIIPVTPPQGKEPSALADQEHTEGPDLDLISTETCLEGGVR